MKILISVLFVLLLPALLIGQDVRYGLTLGMNIAKWHVDADEFASDLAYKMNSFSGASGFYFCNKSRIGVSLGVFADVPIKKSLSFQPELSYSQKGTRFKGNGSIYSYPIEEEIIMQTDYIDLLVLAKHKIGGGKYNPYILAGPGFGYLVSSKMKVEATVDGESESDSEKFDVYKKMDTNICIGGGLDLISSVRFEFKYQFGLSQIFEDDYSDDYKMKNGGWAVSMMVLMHEKKEK